jgi:hypothetical protein
LTFNGLSQKREIFSTEINLSLYFSTDSSPCFHWSSSLLEGRETSQTHRPLSLILLFQFRTFYQRHIVRRQKLNYIHRLQKKGDYTMASFFDAYDYHSPLSSKNKS